MSLEDPGADEALLEQQDDGRTLESSLSQSPPGASAALVVECAPQDHRVHQLPLGRGPVECLRDVIIGQLRKTAHAQTLNEMARLICAPKVSGTFLPVCHERSFQANSLRRVVLGLKL